jgi:tetratricopeptide (TPR) repeat protein
LAWGLRAWRAALERWVWPDALDAVERARRAASELESTGKSVTDAERLELGLALGESYRAAGKLKESASALDAAVTLADRLGDEVARARALLQQGQTGIALGTYREACGSIGEALELSRASGDEPGRVRAVVQLGTAQVAMGDYELAARVLERERASLGSGARDETSGILGWAYLLQGRSADGIALLERALDERQRAGDIRGKALVLRRLHWADLSRGQYETAIQLARSTREEFRRIGDVVGEGKAEMGIGQARIAQGVLEEGVAILERTFERLRTCGDAHCEAEMLWLLGRGHAEAERQVRAMALLSDALEGARRVEDRDDEFRILTDLARLKVDAGDPRAGLEDADRAVAIAKGLRSRDGLGAALAERAQALLALDRPLVALEAAETAVALLEQTGSGERWRGYWALGLATGALERRGAGNGSSLEALLRCVALLDSARDQLPAADQTRRSAVARARQRPLRDCYDALVGAGRTSEAADLGTRWALHSRP